MPVKWSFDTFTFAFAVVKTLEVLDILDGNLWLFPRKSHSLSENEIPFSFSERGGATNLNEVTAFCKIVIILSGL